jgi:hypothetical protein
VSEGEIGNLHAGRDFMEGESPGCRDAKGGGGIGHFEVELVVFPLVT